MQFAKVAEDEGEEPIELPIEEDRTLLQSTLQAQYPACSGLKYRFEKTNAVRGIRFNQGKFYPPFSENEWGTRTYVCVFPKVTKRKNDDDSVTSISKCKRVETGSRASHDLIVLNLPYAVTNESLLKHFETFGEIVMAEVKKDPITGVSRGYGFIRFKYSEAQTRALLSQTFIEGRLCTVKISESKNNSNRKIFVHRCTEDLTADDLQKYFSTFGEVVDIFTPKPFPRCSSVTFSNKEVIKSLIGRDHIVKGVSVHVSNVNTIVMDRRGGTSEYIQNRGMPPYHHNDGWNLQNRYNTITPNLADSGINQQFQNNLNQQQISITPHERISSAANNQFGLTDTVPNLPQKQGFGMRQSAQIGSSNQINNFEPSMMMGVSGPINPAFESNENR